MIPEPPAESPQRSAAQSREPSSGAERRSEPLLVPGRNCASVDRADRAAPLVDAAAYFSALYDALHLARRQILIVGWDIHAFVCLKRGAEGAEAAENLRDMLYKLAVRNPDLAIRILLWDFTVLYSPDRLPFPKAVLDWSMPDNVRLAFDNRLPVGASQHQKTVVIDDAVAFIGGIDITENRWDTSEHAADSKQRKTALGEAYAPFHDVQLGLSGPIAARLGAMIRERWRVCADERVEPPRVESDPWPAGLEARWTGVEVGLARTVPPYESEDGVTEVLELYLDSIRAARECIYFENQYLTADRICSALADRLGEPDGPEVILVTRYGMKSWLEQNTMAVRRREFVERLRSSDAHGRLRVLAPRVPGVDIETFTVHSKVAVVDDRLVRIGTANLNNRSMGFDAECDAAIDCATSADRGAALAFRNALVAEHLGVPTDRVAAAVEERGSLRAAIDALRSDGRSLVDLDVSGHGADFEEGLPELADTDKPLSTRELLDRLLPGFRKSRTAPLRAAVRVVLAVVVIVALVALWRLTPLGEYADPDRVAALLERVPRGFVGGLVVVAAFCVGGLVVFPVTVLIFATALVFGPWLGFVLATLGTYVSAVLTFEIGRWIGKRSFVRWRSATLSAVGKQLARRGMIAIAVVRVVPVAPFSVVNALAGASGVRFRDYVFGTVLGMTPGILGLTAMGSQLGAVLRDPSVGRVAVLVLIVSAWIALGIVLYRLIQRLERRREAKAES